MGLTSIKEIKDRIIFIKTEIVMKNYSDGWTIKGLEDELHKLEEKLKTIKND
jgi:hypothetical protein